MRELISTAKKKKERKKVQAGIEWSNILPTFLASEEKPPHGVTEVYCVVDPHSMARFFFVL